MRVLYVGQTGTERADRWRTFLTQHASSVRVASVTDLGSLDFADIDVTVVDGDPDEEPGPPDILADTDLPLPTVLIGGAGGKVSDAIGLKLGWEFGCLCLNHQAIIDDTALDHAIFQGPAPLPRLTTQDIPSPADFLDYAATKTVPKRITVLDIHAAVADEDSSKPGLVSTSAGFLDSPDCERILGGVHTKAHDYNAVARQGRFLQWGFYGDPTELTDAGRVLFVNCLHYIASFAGAAVEAPRVQWSREVVHTLLGFLDSPEAGDPTARLSELFGPELPDGIGTTTASTLRWYAEHRGYLRRDGVGPDGRFVIDADLAALGMANDDPALLDIVAAGLDAAGPEGEQARRLWSRYLRRDPANAVEEREWLRRHSNHMFFSDWAGYRWIARNDPPTLTVPRAGIAEAGPVLMVLSANRAGAELRLNLQFLMRPGQYIYAPGATDGVATTVDVVSDHVIVTPPAFPETETRHFREMLTVPMAVSGTPDTVELAVRVQACDEQSCTPPTTVRIQATAGDW